MRSIAKFMEKYQITEVGIDLADADISWDEWRWYFQLTVRLAKRSPWAVGDMGVYGEDRFGEDMAQAITKEILMSGYSQGSLYNLFYVSRNVKPSERNPNLSPSHHYHVAKMKPDEQVAWLARAELEQWTVAEFRRQIKKATKGEEHEQQTAVEEEKKKEPEVMKEKSVGHINDQFDYWWTWYSEGKGYDEEIRAVARDAWNANVDDAVGRL